MIVIVAPGVEYALRVHRRRKDVRIQAFVAEPAIEAFDESILHGLAGGAFTPYTTGMNGWAPMIQTILAF